MSLRPCLCLPWAHLTNAAAKIPRLAKLSTPGRVFVAFSPKELTPIGLATAVAPSSRTTPPPRPRPAPARRSSSLSYSQAEPVVASPKLIDLVSAEEDEKGLYKPLRSVDSDSEETKLYDLSGLKTEMEMPR